jgi:hypothetical protein
MPCTLGAPQFRFPENHPTLGNEAHRFLEHCKPHLCLTGTQVRLRKDGMVIRLKDTQAQNRASVDAPTQFREPGLRLILVGHCPAARKYS